MATSYVGFMCPLVCYSIKNVYLPRQHPFLLMHKLIVRHMIHLLKAKHKQAIDSYRQRLTCILKTDVVQMLFFHLGASFFCVSHMLMVILNCERAP